MIGEAIAWEVVPKSSGTWEKSSVRVELTSWERGQFATMYVKQGVLYVKVRTNRINYVHLQYLQDGFVQLFLTHDRMEQLRTDDSLGIFWGSWTPL